jgi:tRNA (guanine37-N1)-methyltransferase
MVLAVKVKLKELGKTKKKLGDNIDKNYHIKVDEDDGYIPVKKGSKLRYKTVKITGRKRKNKKDYRDVLKNILGEDKFSAFDTVGNIAIVRIPEELEDKGKDIGNALLHISNIKTVLKRENQYSGEFRTQKLSYLAGEKNKETVHLESGLRFKLDVEKVYYSVRSGTERLRVAKQVKKDERVLVMFSGCGPFCLILSKHSKASKILGIEKNPVGHKYALENVKLNKIKNVELYKGDVRKVKLEGKFDRIIMPLPKDAEKFLDVAEKYSKKGTIIHLYQFDDWVGKPQMIRRYTRILKKYLDNFKVKDVVRAGAFSPNTYRICVDVLIK